MTLPHPQKTLSPASTEASLPVCFLGVKIITFVCKMNEGAILVVCMFMVNILDNFFVEISQKSNNCSFIHSNLFIVHRSLLSRKLSPLPPSAHHHHHHHHQLKGFQDPLLEALCAEISSQHHSGESPDSPSRPCCTFTYVTMTGEDVELCQRGRSISVR